MAVNPPQPNRRKRFMSFRPATANGDGPGMRFLAQNSQTPPPFMETTEKNRLALHKSACVWCLSGMTAYDEN